MIEKTKKEAAACIVAISELVADADTAPVDELDGVSLVPIRVLLTHAENLLNGKPAARANKNAGDRARRPRKKSPGRKPRKKAPRGTPPRLVNPIAPGG